MENLNNENLENIEESIMPTPSPVRPVRPAKHWSSVFKIFSIRNSLIIAVVLVIGGLVFYYKDILVAATVNGSPISRLAMIRQLEKSAGKNMLEDLITKKLINDEAVKAHITIGEDAINATVQETKTQLEAQGQTLEDALAAQGMTQADLREQIVIRKQLEQLLADKIQVSDDEIQQYIKDNQVTIPAGKEAEYQKQIKDQLQQQKLSSEAGAFVESLKLKASIHYFVQY
ncbi:MAG: hypothetical protein COS76_03380 [Candidatus Portnoybacteria bacterium CG06_land_8_20_14_3_00_39_12]|uniref:PpiC domain-containing protein n=1 Tax=Candidatus Portnoybacteria bacterium CG06_land_8_20_14_3_00_39_12 TaxID=1974809 RepID=A0A2M7AWE3_9BACT|nr:MAG: hypothetical protein COS76_03380 [Candidatus Portnoybacteria bacterium CG06_land_8_20_14_3_00_39_12]